MIIGSDMSLTAGTSLAEERRNGAQARWVAARGYKYGLASQIQGSTSTSFQLKFLCHLAES